LIAGPEVHVKKARADVVYKKFWRDNERFASLFNTVIFGGEDVIKPDSLQEMDTEVSNMIKFKDYREALARARDVVRKSSHGVDFVILGIESQEKTHYAMPLRVMIYDALGYLQEYEDLSHSRKKSGAKLSPEEFLSGMGRDDRLHKIITIVIYYGEEPWDGPLSLLDMTTESSEMMTNAFSDYKMNLVQLREGGKYHFSNEDVQTVFEISGYIFKGKFDKIEESYKDRDIKAELAEIIGLITESDYIAQQAAESKGGMINMCKALEKLKKRGNEQAFARGMEQRTNEIVLNLLRTGVDTSLIKEVSGLDDDKIEKLRKKIQM